MRRVEGRKSWNGKAFEGEEWEEEELVRIIQFLLV